MIIQIPKWLWAIVSILILLIIGWIDSSTSFELNLFVFYFVPVAIVAWFIGGVPAITIAVLSTGIWFWADIHSGHVFESHFIAVWETGIHLISFLIIGKTTSTIRKDLDRAIKTAEELKQAFSEIKVLTGIIPICLQCKSIRNGSGKWERLETYVEKHSNGQFSHGYCPDCGKKLLEDAGMNNLLNTIAQHSKIRGDNGLSPK